MRKINLRMLKGLTIRKQAATGAVIGLLTILPIAAQAHHGPPVPLFENRRAGPCVVSLWTHPDVGMGTFFVMVNPIPGSKVPDDLRVKIGVQPESGRVPEVVYAATRDDSHGTISYDAHVQFDRNELWRVRLSLFSSQGNAEIFSRVEVAPPGYGRWDLLLYLLPFLLVAFLWFRGITRRRHLNKKGRLQAA